MSTLLSEKRKSPVFEDDALRDEVPPLKSPRVEVHEVAVQTERPAEISIHKDDATKRLLFEDHQEAGHHQRPHSVSPPQPEPKPAVCQRPRPASATVKRSTKTPEENVDEKIKGLIRRPFSFTLNLH